MKRQKKTSEFINATELAKVLGYVGPKGSRRVTSAAEAGEIPGRRLNGRWRFHLPTVMSKFQGKAAA
jgi:hypothetical protein